MGKRVTIALKTRDVRVARQRAMKIRTASYEKGFFDFKRPVKKAFSVLAEEVLAYAKDKTKRYEKVYKPTISTLVKFFGSRLIQEVDGKMIEEFQKQRKEEISPVNSNNAVRVLRRMFNFAIEKGDIGSNPTKGITLYKVPEKKIRFLTREEIAVLMKYCAGYLKNIVITALNTGMRKGEILGLKWGNVDLENRIIVLDKTKSNRVREIPMSAVVYDLLVKLYEKNPRQDDYVFVNANNWRYRDVESFRKAVRASGIQPCRFHDLRHTFASQLVMAGVDLATVKELMGHSEIEVTMIYAHLSPEHKKNAISKLENRLGEATNAESGQCSELPRLTLLSGTKLAQK